MRMKMDIMIQRHPKRERWRILVRHEGFPFGFCPIAQY